ncbi:MAG: M24 family metallopeptidase [Syntrophomonadaceae bacterium]|jgi:Xaa-Pro aminopeptidase
MRKQKERPPASRVEGLRDIMVQKQIEAFMVSKGQNIFYLSGFTGGSGALLVVTIENKYILTDSRYREQVKAESPDWEFIEVKPNDYQGLIKLGRQFSRLAVEGHHISYAFYQELQKNIPAEIFPVSNLLEELRLVKDEEEIGLLKEAARIGDKVFAEISSLIRPGMTEKTIADQISYLLRKNGCWNESFDTIVLSGSNAAFPHGRPGSRAIMPGDMVIMDFGGIYEGYAGDMTRTMAASHVAPKFKDYYRILLEAQQTGLAMVKSGVRCRDVDKAVRDNLARYQLDSFFDHGTGHGIGLEVHEAPRISSGSDVCLAENMVITIEPGVYIPGWGGIRIEDSVIVKSGGCEVITQANKELIIF